MEQTVAKQTFDAQTIGSGLTGLLIDRLVRAAAARYPEVYGELGISKPALVVLVALAAEGPLRQARVSERTGIDKATLVALLNELEDRGLARRAPDPSDRRAHAVSVTPEGRRLLDRAVELAAGDDFFAVLSAKERAALDDMLLRLLAAHGA